MDDHSFKPVSTEANQGMTRPVTEAELHAYADHQLSPEQVAKVEQFLAQHPDEQERIHTWRQQNRLLHTLLDPVMNEALPLNLPLRPTAKPFPWRALAASIVVAVTSAGSAWTLRGYVDAQATQLALAVPPNTTTAMMPNDGMLTGFAQRAAIAHVVYSPDVRRPVEVSADQEQALVTWLTKRIGTEIRPPMLTALGYELIGGRLLPGERGPVAQFMYGTENGQRLTLYVTQEIPADASTAFQFGNDGATNVFYWVENNFGYAISAGTDRAELMRVSQEVYAQMKPR
ncbi:anti-sigma factor family protein [Paenalcaligenes suwonensis]|uniref:anti-sigma factor family protein n=1 Tax=Paenalcaligenes suwonensis TaxID=1202713 RepID=UPI001F6096E7|nr:anti-sigma factor [Paenalcaligenes suwonensis]